MQARREGGTREMKQIKSKQRGGGFKLNVPVITLNVIRLAGSIEIQGYGKRHYANSNPKKAGYFYINIRTKS